MLMSAAHISMVEQKSSFPIYLRTLRRTHALTQKDLAFLLGLESRSSVSMLENGTRLPQRQQVVICELLFGKTHAALFPGEHAGFAATLKKRCYDLLKEGGISPAARTKVLEAAITNLELAEVVAA
jgi:transcriptional regulator with XRE-family HTH domain